MAIPATVMYFTMYDQLRDYLFQKQYVSKEYAPVMAGAAARGRFLSYSCIGGFIFLNRARILQKIFLTFFTVCIGSALL